MTCTCLCVIHPCKNNYNNETFRYKRDLEKSHLVIYSVSDELETSDQSFLVCNSLQSDINGSSLNKQMESRFIQQGWVKRERKQHKCASS